MSGRKVQMSSSVCQNIRRLCEQFDGNRNVVQGKVRRRDEVGRHARNLLGVKAERTGTGRLSLPQSSQRCARETDDFYIRCQLSAVYAHFLYLLNVLYFTVLIHSVSSD